MEGKKGSSHIEMIMSFVLFVGFSVFLISYIQPERESSLEESLLFALQTKFFENVTIIEKSVLVDFRNNGENCPSGHVIPCSPLELNGVYNISKNADLGSCFYYIYSSVEFSNVENVDGCKNDNAYKIGYIETKEVLSNNTIKKIEQKYYSNYDGLKKDLGVPPSIDFSITVDGYLDMSRQIPDTVEVKAGLYRESVLFSNGTIQNKDFIIKIW